MAFYDFKCDDCGKDLEVMVSPLQYESITHVRVPEKGDSYLKERCSCGGDLKRIIGQIGMGLDIYKNDPRSNQYWKKGKTNSQVADVIAKKDGNPY